MRGLQRLRILPTPRGLAPLAAAMCLVAISAASAQDVARDRAGEIIPGRYLVIFEPSDTAPAAAAQGLASAHGFHLRHVYRFAFEGMAIALPPGAELDILDALRRNPRVRAIGNDRYVSAVVQSLSTGVDRIEAEPALPPPNTGAGIRVAIIDTGVDFLHLDLDVDTGLSRNCIGGGGGCGPGGQDDNWHGTFVGGLVAARDNGFGIAGVVSDATLISLKVLDQNGSGSFTDVTAALDYLVGLAEGGDVIEVANMSLRAICGVCTDDSLDPTIMAFHGAVQALVAAGTTVVVAAGNDAADTDHVVPAAFDEVITVSALFDLDGQPGGDSFAGFSNFGSDVDVIAPGVWLESLALGTETGTTSGSGTSFSSPLAAGVAAMFIRDRRGPDDLGPAPLPAEVRQALIETGECADGDNGTVFHDGVGCSQVWAGDPDGIPEPMVRADKVVDFGAVDPDVAVLSISVITPVFAGSTETVSVGVENQGPDAATFDVSLSDVPEGPVGTQGVTLLSGASTTLDYSWTPITLGDHVLTATAETLVGEVDTADNSKSTTVTVLDPDPVHDVAVVSISAPGKVKKGKIASISVEVANEGNFDETFDVEVTDDTDATLIGSQSVTLTLGTTTTLFFDWDTTGSSSGEHVLTASAIPVVGEVDLADNSKSTTSTVTGGGKGGGGGGPDCSKKPNHPKCP